MFFKAAKVENETDLQTLANRLSQVTAALSPKELGVSELKPIIEGWICKAANRRLYSVSKSFNALTSISPPTFFMSTPWLVV